MRCNYVTSRGVQIVRLSRFRPSVSIMADNVEARGRYSHTLPIRVCAAQRGRDFKAPGLERGIHF